MSTFLTSSSAAPPRDAGAPRWGLALRALRALRAPHRTPRITTAGVAQTTPANNPRRYASHTMNGLMLRLNIMAFLGLFLAAPFALVFLLARDYPDALGMTLAAILCAAFMGVQLAVWARSDRSRDDPPKQ